MFFASFSCLSPIGRLFFRWVRASAPTGCSPRDSGRLFAIGSDLYVLDILCSSFLHSSYRETLLPVGARKRTQRAPTGCSPRDSGRLFAIDSDLLLVAV